MISQNRKQRIRQQALRAAARQAAPSAAQIRKARKAARKDYRGQVQSTKGAVTMLQGALDSAIAGAKDSGLRGKYLQDTVAELAAQKGDAAQIVPFTKAGLRSDLKDTLSGLRDDMGDLRTDQAQSARDAFRSKLEDIRQAKESNQADRVDAKQQRAKDAKNATIILHNLIEDTREAADVSIKPPADDATDSEKEQYAEDLKKQRQQQRFLANLYAGDRSTLRHAAAVLASKAEGLDQSEAMAFLKRYIAQRNEQSGYGLKDVGQELQNW